MVNIICVGAFLAFAVTVGAYQPHSFASHMNPFLTSRVHSEKEKFFSSRSVTLNNVTQRVDNFDPQNEDTFEQRYFMNNEFFQPGGPIILMLGGFYGITDTRLRSSMPLDIARELGGNLVYLEHRYYGESYPVAYVIRKPIT